MTISIVKPRTVYIDDLFDIYLENVSKRKDKFMGRSEFESAIRSESVIIAENEQNEVCGFISYLPLSGFIHLLFVKPSYQKQGIGSALIQELINRDESYSHRLKLMSAINSTDAHLFYEKQGFTFESTKQGSLNLCKVYVLNYKQMEEKKKMITDMEKLKKVLASSDTISEKMIRDSTLTVASYLTHLTPLTAIQAKDLFQVDISGLKATSAKSKLKKVSDAYGVGLSPLSAIANAEQYFAKIYGSSPANKTYPSAKAFMWNTIMIDNDLFYAVESTDINKKTGLPKIIYIWAKIKKN